MNGRNFFTKVNEGNKGTENRRWAQTYADKDDGKTRTFDYENPPSSDFGAASEDENENSGSIDWTPLLDPLPFGRGRGRSPRSELVPLLKQGVNETGCMLDFAE
jgi:hypothetical protein